MFKTIKKKINKKKWNNHHQPRPKPKDWKALGT
jgi:hypothetical protein